MFSTHDRKAVLPPVRGSAGALTAPARIAAMCQSGNAWLQGCKRPGRQSRLAAAKPPRRYEPQRLHPHTIPTRGRHADQRGNDGDGISPWVRWKPRGRDNFRRRRLLPGIRLNATRSHSPRLLLGTGRPYGCEFCCWSSPAARRLGRPADRGAALTHSTLGTAKQPCGR